MTTTSRFRQFLENEYAADPSQLGGLADRVCRLVRVVRSHWRGQYKIRRAKVLVDNEEIDPKVVGGLTWKFLPKDIRREFAALENSIDRALRLYSVGGGHSSERQMASLVGNGVYVVDTAYWPRLQSLLEAAAQSWAQIADRLCTEEGYEELMRKIREAVGDDHFEAEKRRFPSRHLLRSKFGLHYEVLPVRLAPDTDRDAEPGVARGRRSVVLDAIESVVRGPREALADALEHFANTLTTPAPSGDPVNDRIARPGTCQPDGNTYRPRVVRVATVAAVSAALEQYRSFGRYVDPELRSALQLLVQFWPTRSEDDEHLARTLTRSDSDAVRYAVLALRVAQAARDENGMCAAIASAMQPV